MSYGDDVLLDELLNPFHRPGQGWYDKKPEEEKEDKVGPRNNKKIHSDTNDRKGIQTKSKYL